MSLLGTTLIALGIGAPVPEAPTPSAVADGQFLLVSDARPGNTPLSLRIVSGYSQLNSLQVQQDDDLTLVHSHLGISTQLSQDWSLHGDLRARVLIGDPLASTPSRVDIRLRYAPKALRSKQVALGFFGFGLDRGGRTPR